MKTAIVLACLLCATAAFGQVGATLSNEVQPIQLPSHPQRASSQGMSVEQNLLVATGYTAAHGNRPLWEFASLTPEVPLGDVARELRKAHETARKAEKVWAN